MFARLPGSRVLIRPLDENEKRPSGLVLPKTVVDKEPAIVGEVVQVGSGSLTEHGDRIPVQVRVGDKVLFQRFSGMKVEHGGETFYLINERDILAVVDEG